MQRGRDEGPGRPGLGQRAEVRRRRARRRPPAARSPGSGRAARPSSATSGPAPEPTRARSSTIASPAPASARRASASAALAAGQRRVGREHAPAAQVEAEHERRLRQRGPEPPERVGAGQRLRADHDAGDAEREQPRDRRRRRAAPASTITRASRASAATTSGLPGAARDRVEVGDVELVEAEPLAHRARHGHGVRPVGDPAPQRAIAFALPADGVHGDAALEIDDRDHSHDREGSRMGGVIGLDIGGANTKAVWRDGDAVRTRLAPVRGLARPRGAGGRRCATSWPPWRASRRSWWR